MTKRNPLPDSTYPPGYFSEPVTQWKSMQFRSDPLFDVSQRTGKFMSDFERSQQCRNAGGWNKRPMELPGSLT